MVIKHKKLKTIIPELPTRSFSITGKPCEPISLIVLGPRHKVQKVFIKHGWFPAVSINPVSTLRALGATILNAGYISGPVSPYFINKRPHHLAFQKPTRSNTFRRRHHLRLWKTPYTLDKKRVWVGMLSYDRSTGFYKNSIFPTHHISSNLSSEENFLARTLKIEAPAYVRLGEPEVGVISNGDPYVWDGKALVIDL